MINYISNIPLVLHDNARAHEILVAKAALKDCDVEELSHPASSQHLAPCDVHLVPNLKGLLIGTHFEDDNELKTATEGYGGKHYNFE